MQFWWTLRISCNCNTPPRTLSSPKSITATWKCVGVLVVGLPCFDDAASDPTPSASSAVMSRSDHGCLQRRRSSPLGGFKPAQAGRTSGDVFIPHFPPCSASVCLQMLRRVSGGGSVKNYVCISCQTYTPSFLHHQAGVPECQSIGSCFVVGSNPTLLADYYFLRLDIVCSSLRACLGACLGPKRVDTSPEPRRRLRAP